MTAIRKMNEREQMALLDKMTNKYKEFGLKFIDIDTSQKTRILYTYLINGNEHTNTENEITWMLGIWGNKRRSFEKSKAEVYGYWRRNQDLMEVALERGVISLGMAEEIMGGKRQSNKHEETLLDTDTIHKEKSPIYDLDPEFITELTNLNEGSVMQVTVNRYERNHEAREKCIALNGCKCMVCGMNFEKTYGEIGKGFIHVHHTTPISAIGKSYNIDYAKDLVPVCPNCHAMMHKKTPPYTVSEMKEILTHKKQTK